MTERLLIIGEGQRHFVRSSEIAAFYGVSKTTVCRWIRLKMFAGVQRPGNGEYFIPVDEFERFKKDSLARAKRSVPRPRYEPPRPPARTRSSIEADFQLTKRQVLAEMGER